MSDYTTLSARALALTTDPSQEFTAFQIEDAFRESLTRYESDVPRLIIEDLAGTGSAYDFALTGWVDRFSAIERVEYPAGRRPALYLEATDWDIYRTVDTTKLRLQLITPGSTETVRVTYTARHTIDGLDGATATTVYAWHEDAVVNLAAANLMQRAADRYLHEQGGSMLDADVVDRQAKADVARRLASALEARYNKFLNIESGVRPAGGVIDWDLTFAGSGLDKLTHPRRWR